ncbi:MAG: hypothetical protein Q8O67_09325 [Deltaproteobacteria bacterium]|nr:hypothetical protein [Deltaproteobacteria bacterium]
MATKKKKKSSSSSKKKVAKKKVAAKKKPAKKVAKKKVAKTAPKKRVAAKKKPAKKKPAKKKASSSKVKVKVKGTRHEPSVFLLVHLPIGIEPLERGDRFEDPIDDALGALGAVSGGGTALSESGQPQSCDIEVEVHDVAHALPILRRVLSENAAPKGTIVTRLSSDGVFEVLLEL